MLSRMKYINRWGLMRNTINENIAEHSLETAFIAHGLAVIGNTYFGKDIDENAVAVAAMFHDTTEIITGDMPTPVKYFEPNIKEAYKKVEKEAQKKLLSSLPDEMRQKYHNIYTTESKKAELYRYVKAADKLSALIKCIEERKMGNMDFESAEETTLKSVKKMEMEEAEYFIEHFLPAYSFTLDEQTKE
ncbi:MAG: 5'-deoxynucleotidase [Lachnospiraceae bacterium]|nr:5'-deoxynucleotidase [Lachnospiraceae bacterium]